MITKKPFGRHDSLPNFSAMSVAGVDEAGRGTLAGPVIAAAVILPKSRGKRKYYDSKQLNADKRTQMCRTVKQEAVAWALGRAEVSEIDQMNILNASLLAMVRALKLLVADPHLSLDLILIDGNRTPDFNLPCCAVVGGDDRIESISAASIVAKVERDKEMLQLHKRYPIYNFASHKGYPTKEHIKNLDKYGVCNAHRKSYRPIKERLAKGLKKMVAT